MKPIWLFLLVLSDIQLISDSGIRHNIFVLVTEREELKMGKLLVTKMREINPLVKRGVLLTSALLGSFACLLRPRQSEGSADRNVSLTKVGLVSLCTLLVSVFMAGGWYAPEMASAASTPRTYYMRADTTTYLNVDGTCNLAGTTPYTVAGGLAYTTASTTNGTTGHRYYPGVTPQGVPTVIARIYSPAYTANAMDISAISASLAMRDTNITTRATVALNFYDYDPTGIAGNKTLVATGTAKPSTNTSTTTQGAITWTAGNFTISGTGRVLQNHMLLCEVVLTNGAATLTPRIYFDITGATTTTSFSLTETDVAGLATTTPGAVNVTAFGSSKINVTASYSDDSNSNNTLLVEYKRSIDPGYTPYVTLPHAANPYVTSLSGLTPSTSYDVRVTYQDPNGVTGTAQEEFLGITTTAQSVEAYQSWTRVINDSTTRATGTAVNLSGNFTVTAPNGSSRFLVVAITQHNTANTAPAAPTTITYGGTTLTLATTNRATSARQHTWFYYLKDNPAVMNGVPQTLALGWSAGIASTKIDVYCNEFTSVDQTAPIIVGNRMGNTAATTGASLSAAMSIAANSLAIYVIDDLNTTNTTIPVWTPNVNWRDPLSLPVTGFTGTSGTYGYRHEIAQRALPATTTTDNAITGTRTSSRYAMSALVLPTMAVSLNTGAVAPNLNVYAGDTFKVVDTFNLTGSGTLTNIQVTGNANTTNTNISAVRIYRKEDANTTVYSVGVDTLIGSGTFGAVGTTPIDIAVSEVISGTSSYIIVYDVATSAIASGTSITFTGAVTALTPAAGALTDTGATLTLYPTITIGNGIEPPSARLWKSSAATNLNAFTLSHNGAAGDDDTISDITVALSPAFISGGSGGTISKLKLVEVVNAAGTTVYGSLNLATNLDLWNIPTTGLIATSTPVTYYIRVSTADTITPVPIATDPSGNGLGFYSPITANVTSIIHAKSNNMVINNDTTSASLSIDVEKPNGPATATASEGATPGEINLVWDAVSDSNGGALAADSVVIRRSVGNGVAPDSGCASTTDGSTDLSTVPGVTINYALRTVTDNGLISDNPTRYYYRVCSKDALGNVSDGAQTYANAKVQSICDRAPSVTLAYEDGGTTSSMQLIKSSGSAPFKLQIANNDIGTCPDVIFDIALANVVGNESHFDKTVGGNPFPSTVTLGTGGAGASTGKTLNVIVTGLEATGAQQLEQYKFAVTVSSPGNSHGAPITTPQVTGLLNDMPPIVHNSANMAKYQYGSWGQTYTCATCHSNSTTNIKGVYQIISTPIGRRNVVFTKTSSIPGLGDAVYSDDQRPVKNVSNSVCSVCHHQTRQHQYSASKTLGGPGADETYNSDHHNSRDCVKCHTHNSAFRSIYGLCGDCHGFKATGYSPLNKSTMVKDITNALGPNPPNYGAHARHNMAKITCGACHSNTNHGLEITAWAGDNKLEIGFNANKDTYLGFNPDVPVTGGTFYGTNNLNQPFTWLAGAGTTISPIADYNNSCSTYCHGGASWAAGGNVGSNTTPIWVGTGQVACGTCHNATGLVPPTSGSHLKHAASTGAGLGIACIKCHATYTNYTGSAHINGKVEWNMSAYPGSLYGTSNAGNTGAPAPTATGNYTTCSTLYCHSNIQGADGTGLPTAFATPTWGGTAACNSCHAATPNDSGSHLNHENAEVSFDCHVCHNNGGTTSPLNHSNGTINFQFVGLAQNTVYSNGNNVTPGTAYGTCSASDCHGRFTRAWGTPASGLTLCEKCHGSATSAGGFYNTQGPTGTLSVYSTGVGVHDIHIQNLNSPRKATFSRYTSYAVGYGCEQCHTVPDGPFSAGHIDTALPGEVPFNNSSSIAHKGDAFGYYSTPTYSSATQTCSAVWCHGAGMHSNRASHEYVGTTPPVRTNPKWNVPYLTGNGANDCTKCHALPPPAPDATYTHFGKTLASCASCHQHVSADGHGFKEKVLHVNGTVEGGCDGCHGNPPITAVDGPPDGKAGQNAIDGAGAHAAHVLLPQIGNNCSTCHNLASSAMPSTNLEIGFKGLGGLVTTGTFTGYTNSVSGPKWVSSSAGTTVVKSNVKEAVCSNLYCHGGGSASPVRPALGGGVAVNPNWEVPAVCGDCHGVDSGSAPTGGSHPRHALTVASLTCESCHGVTNDNGTHVNAAVTWRLDRTNPVIGSLATYNNTSSGSLSGLAPRGITAAGDDYRTCNNVYCHSTVQSGNGTGAPTFKSPRWGTDNGTLGCNGCHQNMATDPAPTASHLKHANTTSGMNVPCGYCHQDGGDGTAIHADGMVFVNFTSYVGGIYSVGTPYLTGVQKSSGAAAFGTCAATFCHGSTDSPVWGSPGPLACNACHSAKVDDVNWSGRHNTHYNYSTMPTNYTQTVTDLSSPNKYRFNCAHCHDDNIAKHSLKPASVNSAARVFFGISSATPAASSKRGVYAAAGSAEVATDNGFKYTAGSCNTSYCHSNGRGGAPLNTALTWMTTPSGNNCLYCHDGKSATVTASLLSGKHDKHMNPLNNAMMGTGNGFNCVDCHAPAITNSNNITIANKAMHVNATLNYSGAKARKNYTAGQCSYCHSNGNPGAVVFINMTGSKVWTSASGAITTCNKCHGRSNAYGYPDYANGGANSATSNLHSGHFAGMTDTTACADCHRKTGDATTINKFRAYSTLHLNGLPNVSFNTAKSYIGSKAAVATVGNQVTCSTVVCHGQGAPVWGTSTAANQCQKCHGSRTQAFVSFSSPQVAPGYGTDGTDTSMTKKLPTDPRVGAHQRHLLTNVLSAPVKCGECHVTVTSIRSANHWNYSTATLTFTGGRATNNHTPSVSRTGGVMQCSNINCHSGYYNSGTTIAPFWNVTGMVKETGTTVGDCVKCHAMAPSAVTNHPAALTNSAALSTIVASCQGCHTNISSSITNVGNAFGNKSLHINGIIEVVQNCDSCHSYDTTAGGTAWGTSNYGGTAGMEGRGAHVKHIEYLKAKNPTLSLLPTDTWTSPSYIAICGPCHSTNPGTDHSMSTPTNPRSITFGGGGHQFGASAPFYNGSTASTATKKSSALKPKSCSNLDCHYRTSPIWSTY